jgi:hypothetical protein
VANQLSVRDAFGMQAEHVAMDALHLITKTGSSEDEVFRQAASSLGCKFDTSAEKATFRAGLRDFALAQYHNTQKHLSSMGIKEVYVARGMKLQGSGPEQVQVKLQPASSFSANYGTAKSFAGGKSVFLAKVPASQVLSSYVTGFGCSSEHEVVVLAHPSMQAVQMATSYGQSLEQATQSAAQKFGLKVPTAPAPGNVPAPTAAQTKNKKLSAQTAGASLSPPVNNNAWTKAAYTAMKNGDVEKVKAQLTGIKAKGGYPNSTAYIEALLMAMPKNTAPTEEPDKLAGTKYAAAPAKPVEKNAYYYQKLSKAVKGHPLMNSEVYANLKKKGMGHEQMLEWLKKQHGGAYA